MNFDSLVSMKIDDLYKLSQQHPILFYDGECVLCSNFVQRINRLDKNHQFRYASLQSQIGQDISHSIHSNMNEINTTILLYKEKSYILSDVAIKIGQILGFPHSMIAILYLIPSVIRNYFYKIIAKNRYQWFGKYDTCEINPSLAEKYIG